MKDLLKKYQERLVVFENALKHRDKMLTEMEKEGIRSRIFELRGIVADLEPKREGVAIA